MSKPLGPGAAGDPDRPSLTLDELADGEVAKPEPEPVHDDHEDDHK